MDKSWDIGVVGVEERKKAWGTERSGRTGSVRG